MAREVYTNCVRGALSQKTRILVTNQLQFVAGSDRVLFMSEGKIEEAGSYNELMKAGKGFAKLMQQAEVIIIDLALFHTPSVGHDAALLQLICASHLCNAYKELNMIEIWIT